MARKKKCVISLTEKELSKLKYVIRKKATTRNMKDRCQILISLNVAHVKQYTQEQCAKSIGVCKATVCNIIKYYVDGGIEKVISTAVRIILTLLRLFENWLSPPATVAF